MSNVDGAARQRMVEQILENAFWTKPDARAVPPSGLSSRTRRDEGSVERYVSKNFQDFQVEPYPAVGLEELKQFHAELDNAFKVLHKSRCWGDEVITEITAYRDFAWNDRYDDRVPQSRSLWRWTFVGDRISCRRIYPEPWSLKQRARGPIATIAASVRSVGTVLALLTIFSLAVLSPPALEVWRQLTGDYGARNPNPNVISWWLYYPTAGAWIFGVLLLIAAIAEVFLSEQHLLFPARQKGGLLWLPPIKCRQLAPPFLVVSTYHLVFAASFWLATSSLPSGAPSYRLPILVGCQVVLAIIYAAGAGLAFAIGRERIAAPLLGGAGCLGYFLFLSLGSIVSYFMPDYGVQLAPFWFLTWAVLVLALLILARVTGALTNMPVVTSLIFLLLLNSVFGGDDHHQVDTTPAKANPPLIGAHFAEWLADPTRGGSGEQQRKYPVFIVASEGGGIRAAIMTAMVLDELRARYGDFEKHLFAVIGVSGGSVGAAAYAAATAAGKRPVRLAELASDESSQGWQAVLHEDLLTPAIRGLLGPDFVTRFVPRFLVDLSEHDRAHALEKGFRSSWSRTNGDDFKLSFSDVKPSFINHQPALILLTTDTDTGDRMAVSHVRFIRNPEVDSDAVGCPSVPLRTLADVNSEIDVPLVTAAFMSARFPVISPASRIVGRYGHVFHYVDGGYYENSGVSTAKDVIDGIKCKAKNAQLVVIRIENSESDLPKARDSDLSSLLDITGPIGALYNSRERHGEAAVRQLEADELSSSCNGCVKIKNIRLKLAPPTDNRLSLALSWFISPRARAEIAKQLSIDENAKKLSEIGELLK